MTHLPVISEELYIQYSTDDARIERSMISEVFSYYSTALAWIRILALKDLQRQPMTPTERNLLLALQSEKFSVRKPLNTFLLQ